MYDVAVIGAGIVGLATAFRLQERQPGIRLLVVDKEQSLAAHQTGHNSGVIHSGIYYKPGSLKARNCRAGVQQLLEFCHQNDVEYQLCGKVIVATSAEELPRLQELHERGLANGVPDLELIGPERLRELEPQAAGLQALHSPSTGVIDFSAVATALGRNIHNNGGEIHLGTKVLGLKLNGDDCTIETTTGEYHSHKIINCAGLYSDRVATLSGVKPDLQVIPFRGEYYVLKPESRQLVRTLIYPVPDPRFPFLGVHFTRGIDGVVEAGPNAVPAAAREGYTKSTINLPELWETITYPAFWSMAGKFWRMGCGEIYRSCYKPAFVKALQKLVPAIRSSDLTAGGAGVRAQALLRDGRLSDDFAILQNDRIINILNAPSPAATACLAIGETVAGLVLN